MGVDVKMITGDHIAIAREVATLLNLGANVIRAKDFLDKGYSELTRIVEEANGFAEVFPEHKYVIVDALQKHGHIVAMTGDGVNDAPALKKADVGIAVQGATDAARASSDIVLANSGLSVIVDAIKESRKIFQKMQNYAVYRIAETIRVLFFIALSIIVFNFYPVTATMIILLALLNDIPILSIAYDNVVYSEKPEKWELERLLVVSTILGIVGLISSFVLFFIANSMISDHEVIRTFMFLKLAVAGHLTIFVTRTRGPFWSIKPGSLLLGSAIGTKLIATLFAIFGVLMAPIGFWYAFLIWGYCLAWFLVEDYVKIKCYNVWL
jgi:H+-transporting ATPase